MRLITPLLAAVTLIATASAQKLNDLAPLPEVKPLQKDEIQKSITRGVDFLLKHQNPDGSWGTSRKTKSLNIYAPGIHSHLAFRTGSTCLALKGILDTGDHRPEVVKAIDNCEKWLFKNLPRGRHVDPGAMYNVWGHAYALRTLAGLYKYRKNAPEKLAIIKKLAQGEIKKLNRIEDINGGWGYYDMDEYTKHISGLPTSFTTATVLLGLKEASTTIPNLELPTKNIKRAIASINKQRTPDWAFVYSFPHRMHPRSDINRPAGSLARSQACLTALRKFDDKRITDKLLSHWLQRLCLREGWLSIGRKRPIPHETHFAISGYFYYYGMYYASESFSLLPLEKQKIFLPHLARLLLTKQEKDGSWWDYPLYSYHQAYGTGYALTALSRLRNAQ